MNEERRLLREVEMSNAEQARATLITSELGARPGGLTTSEPPGAQPGDAPAVPNKPKGGVEGFKEGMSAAADGIENFFRGGTP